jgi:hypothetical protein
VEDYFAIFSRRELSDYCLNFSDVQLDAGLLFTFASAQSKMPDDEMFIFAFSRLSRRKKILARFFSP